MSAEQRLTEAMFWSDDPAAILAADPTLAQDIEDGAALRRLREALPKYTYLALLVYDDGLVNVLVKDAGTEVGDGDGIRAYQAGSQIAVAVDAARRQAEAQR